MKRFVILFLISVLGIVLVQVLGGYIFNLVPENFHTLVAVSALSIKLLLYGALVYILVVTRKFSEGRGLKLFKILNWLVVIFLTLVFVAYFLILTLTLVENHKFFNSKELNEIPSTAVEAKVNALVDYNGMSKDFILSLREGNIDSNFLQLTNYAPRNEVWGELENNGTWFSLNRSVCFDPKTDCSRKLQGVSAMSRLINNPMILVAPVMIATYHLDEKFPVCSDKGLKLVPKKVFIDTVNSKVIATYSGTKALTKCKYLQLSGLNARDFGFDWAKVSQVQNVYFPYQKNISKEVYQFQDKIIPDNYCKNSDKKCNVLAPIDDKVVFNVTSYPAKIELKLWKQKPFFSLKSSDYNMEIRFEE